jgi:hypothetical protein
MVEREQGLPFRAAESPPTLLLSQAQALPAELVQRSLWGQPIVRGTLW